MKIIKKLKVIAVILVVTITLSVCSVSAFALEDIIGGLAGSGDLSALDDILGGFNLENFDINSILGAFSGSDYSGILGSIISSLGDEYAGFTNNEILVAIGKVINEMIANGGDISKVDFDSSEFIALIGKYLKPSTGETTTAGEETTAEPATEATTVPQEVTTVPSEAVTRPPATSAQPSSPPVYQNSPVYETKAPETTTAQSYAVVTQATVTTPELTQQYNVTDKNDNASSDKSVTKQMIIGIVILVLSAAAVVVVAVFLKKSREQ